MWSAKRFATQLGKPFQPMRTASLAAFTRALREVATSSSPVWSGKMMSVRSLRSNSDSCNGPG
jgi:hypothetical protein